MIENPEEMQFYYTVVKDFLTSISGVIRKKMSSKKDEDLKIVKLETSINSYLEKKFLEFSYVKPLALLGESINLEKIYQPLTLEKDYSSMASEKKSILIDEFKLEIFKNTSRILIEDSAGMGKTTLLKYLFTNYVRNNNFSKEFIPLFLEIRNFNDEENTLIDIIKKNFYDKTSEISSDVIDTLLEQKLLIFFDGFDEIIESKKEKAITEINEFTSKYNSNLYILTSRSDQTLSNIPMYEKYKIKPLGIKEAVSLLKKYNNVTDNESNTIQYLIREIIKGHKVLTSFLKNPLLTSLLYRSYIYKKNLPISKAEFYNQVYNALYEEHDISTKKGFTRKITISKYELQNFLSDYSFTNIKDLKIEFSENELIEKIEEIKEKQNLIFNTASLITNLYREVPLFIKEGGLYYWSHKSFQEYFIALKINKLTNKEEFIRRLMFSKNVKNYLNILEFLYDLDSKLFLRIFLEKIEEKRKEIFDFDNGFSTEIKEKLFLYPQAYFYIINKRFSIPESNDFFYHLVSKNKNFGTIDQRGIVNLYHDKTTFLRVNCSNFYEVAKILLLKKVEIFKKEDSEVNIENLLLNFKENTFYNYSEKEMDKFNDFQKLIYGEFGEDYVLLDFNKVTLLLEKLNEENKLEAEFEEEVLSIL